MYRHYPSQIDNTYFLLFLQSISHSFAVTVSSLVRLLDILVSFNLVIATPTTGFSGVNMLQSLNLRLTHHILRHITVQACLVVLQERQISETYSLHGSSNKQKKVSKIKLRWQFFLGENFCRSPALTKINLNLRDFFDGNIRGYPSLFPKRRNDVERSGHVKTNHKH